ncbi:MAG: sugar phosphate isomerase/epimerase [Bryobacterales bacterium]|nr:sugar phosphate isomerase/epimerase [Bryobacterales bacterium]
MPRLTPRRHLFAAAVIPLLKAASRIDVSRLSAITDEIGRSPEEAAAFARQYGLSWVELRSVPGGGGEYAFLPEGEVKAAAGRLREAGLRVSFLNTSLLKFGFPGAEPVRRRPETSEARAVRLAREKARFEGRLDELRKAIRAAHIFDTGKLRVFTGTRVADPPALYPRLAEILGGMAEVAGKEGVQLLVENEPSCNIGSCAELAAFLKLLPSKWIGINWDALNGAALNETPFPDGYGLLPKARIGNVQIKGRSVLNTPQRLDWKAIMQAMARDGYQGHFGLETHIFDGTLIESSHASVREMLRIVREL